MLESFRLRPDAAVHIRDGGSLALRQGRFQLVMDKLGVGRRSLVLRLADSWATGMELDQLVATLEGEGRILQGRILLRGLITSSWVARRLHTDDQVLLETIPRGLGPGSLPQPVPHQPRLRYRLSRFAVSRVLDGRLVIETPLSTLALGIWQPALGAALVSAANDGIGLAELAAAAGAQEAGQVLDELLTARVLVASVESETEAAPLAVWSAEDLWMHERSRPGRHVLPVGGTCRLQGIVAPQPLARTFPDNRAIELQAPDLDVVAKQDPTLTEVVNRRHTVRAHDDENPISLGQLAEFLFRVQRLMPSDDGQDVGRRPYPSGGSLCELEVYALVSRCDGLEPAVYHYDSLGHRLELLRPLTSAARRVVSYAAAAGRFAAAPQVSLVITARAGRMMWKYEGIGYAMALKNAGVLTELMYLVATAMGLAPCAIGAGDAAAFANAAGVDPLVEPSIAEFLLGSVLAQERGRS
jgi:SagB-type dehydrogenase family enzyme